MSCCRSCFVWMPGSRLPCATRAGNTLQAVHVTSSPPVSGTIPHLILTEEKEVRWGKQRSRGWKTSTMLLVAGHVTAHFMHVSQMGHAPRVRRVSALVSNEQTEGWRQWRRVGGNEHKMRREWQRWKEGLYNFLTHTHSLWEKERTISSSIWDVTMIQVRQQYQQNLNDKTKYKYWKYNNKIIMYVINTS